MHNRSLQRLTSPHLQMWGLSRRTSTIGQCNLTESWRIATAHERFNGIRQVASVCTTSNASLPTRIHNPNGISIDSAVFEQITALRQRVAIIYNGPPPTPLKLPHFIEDLDPHLIHGSLGPPEFSNQTAPWSVEPFCTAYYCDRPTDHATRSVTVGDAA